MARMKGGLSGLILNDAEAKPADEPETQSAGRLSVVAGQASPTEVEVKPQEQEKPAKTAPAPSTRSAAKKAAPAATKRKAPAPRAAEPTVDDAELPKYLQLERKDLRLRADQLDALTTWQRRLNKVRRGRGERITENTLVRVAIDLLLERADELGGFTEDELRASVGLEAVGDDY